MERELRQALADLSVLQDEAKVLMNKEDATAQEMNNMVERIKRQNDKVNAIKAREESDSLKNHHGIELTGNGGAMCNRSTGKGSGFKTYNKANASELVSDFQPEDSEESGLHIGAYVRGALTGNWDNAVTERRTFASLSTGTGSVIVPQTLSAQIMQAVMNKSLLYGTVPVTTMVSNNLTIARTKSAPSIDFAAEGAMSPEVTFDSTTGAYSTSGMTFDAVKLETKTVRGLVKISNELLSSAANLDEAVTTAFADGIAVAIDTAALYGDGKAGHFTGVMNTSGINTIDGSSLTNYASYVNAVGAIRRHNGEPTYWGINAVTDTKLNGLTATDGNPLQIPPVLSGLNRTVSNNLRAELAKDGTLTGTGDKTFSESLIFDPTAMLFGQQMAVQFISTNTGMDALATNSTYLNICTSLDFVVLQPEFISRIYGI